MLFAKISSVAFGIVAVSISAFAQSAPPATVRGEVVALKMPMIEVKSQSGASFEIKIKDPTAITAVIPALLSDVKPGVFVGVAIQPEDDGTLRAIEVHIFPEALRGTGEGTRAYDLAPGSIMTNASVSAVVAEVDGTTFKLSYKGGEQLVRIDKNTPVVTFAPGFAADLVPSASVILRGVAHGEGGVYETARVIVGRDGLKLPM